LLNRCERSKHQQKGCNGTVFLQLTAWCTTHGARKRNLQHQYRWRPTSIPAISLVSNQSAAQVRVSHFCRYFRHHRACTRPVRRSERTVPQPAVDDSERSLLAPNQCPGSIRAASERLSVRTKTSSWAFSRSGLPFVWCARWEAPHKRFRMRVIRHGLAHVILIHAHAFNFNLCSMSR
jgi:hypothetical protein